MIASLSQIVYIAFVKSEPINEKIVQKGKAISKLDNAGTFQTFQFCQYLPISDTNSDDSDFDDNGEKLKQDYVYHITEKFALRHYRHHNYDEQTFKIRCRCHFNRSTTRTFTR